VRRLPCELEEQLYVCGGQSKVTHTVNAILKTPLRLAQPIRHEAILRRRARKAEAKRPGYPAGRPLFTVRPRPAQLMHPARARDTFSRTRSPPSFLKCPDVCSYTPGELSLTSNAGMTGGRDE
jgi:hypothetical protein